MTKAKIKVIEDTGIVKGLGSNGAQIQRILFLIGEHQFKIDIRSESYDHQSFAVLKKWTDSKGFSTIIGKNPKRDYGVDVAYKQIVRKDAFKAIITDLKRIATDFVA